MSKRKADEKRRKKGEEGAALGACRDLLFNSDGYATVGGGWYDPQMQTPQKKYMLK